MPRRDGAIAGLPRGDHEDDDALVPLWDEGVVGATTGHRDAFDRAVGGIDHGTGDGAAGAQSAPPASPA